MFTPTEGSHREPCSHCGRWMFPIRSAGDGWVTYKCLTCGHRWKQPIDQANHSCIIERCNGRCGLPNGDDR